MLDLWDDLPHFPEVKIPRSLCHQVPSLAILAPYRKIFSITMEEPFLIIFQLKNSDNILTDKYLCKNNGY